MPVGRSVLTEVTIITLRFGLDLSACKSQNLDLIQSTDILRKDNVSVQNSGMGIDVLHKETI
jgi:hypothetical protein